MSNKKEGVNIMLTFVKMKQNDTEIIKLYEENTTTYSIRYYFPYKFIHKLYNMLNESQTTDFYKKCTRNA